MSKKTKTLVCFVLDQSGSMWTVKSDTIGGYNEYVNALRDEKGMSMMLTRFSTKAVEIGEPKPIKEAVKLGNENYSPGGGTPLYDATAKSINKAEECKAKHTLVVIMTDGEENSSHEYSKEALFALIKEKETEGWKFAYLGANQDAYAIGGGMGISRNATMNYNQANTVRTFNEAAKSTKNYAIDPTADDDFFDDEQEEKVK